MFLHTAGGAVLGGRWRLAANADRLRHLLASTPTQISPRFTYEFETALRSGRGAVYLDLTAEQHAGLVQGVHG